VRARRREREVGEGAGQPPERAAAPPEELRRDPEHERARPIAPVVVRQRAREGEEGVVDDVVDVGRAAGGPGDESPHGVVVAGAEGAERGELTGGDARDELGVGALVAALGRLGRGPRAPTTPDRGAQGTAPSTPIAIPAPYAGTAGKSGAIRRVDARSSG